MRLPAFMQEHNDHTMFGVTLPARFDGVPAQAVPWKDKLAVNG
ncbi:hypothetical protein [Brevibacillus laterosporus]|nr:hypothetical protein [Brevibacillus laterosporus]